MSALIDALKTALEKDPDNPELRFHLCEAFVKVGRWQDALDQCGWLLARKPDDLPTLKLAAEAARSVGDDTRADAYLRLYGALSGTEEPERESDPVPSTREPGPYATAPRPLEPDLSNQDSSTAQEPSHDPDEEEGIKLKAIDGGLAEPFWEEETETITLADVAGMEHVKKRLNLAFLAPMRNPEMTKLYGKSLRGGLLLYGPPGCGKTYIARATAGELRARFIHVGISDVLDMYIGESERNLHQIFENARRKAPCVLFFDEIDALGRKRSLMRESAARGIVNQLLAELDSANQPNHGVFVLAATNHPWDVDTALRRPGRFDRMLLVLPPDRDARLAIIQRQLENRPLEKFDFTWLVEKTEGFSGADIVHLCESMAEQAMEDSILSGEARPIRKSDGKKALKEVKATTRPWFETARNFALFANEGGLYDDLIDYLRAKKIM